MALGCLLFYGIPNKLSPIFRVERPKLFVYNYLLCPHCQKSCLQPSLHKSVHASFTGCDAASLLLRSSTVLGLFFLIRGVEPEACSAGDSTMVDAQTCHSIEMKNLDLTNKKSGSGGKNRDHGPIGHKKK